MEKVLYIFRELFYLISRHKIYFLAPIFITLAVLAVLVYQIGPAAIVTFLYAGI